jgi:hypothetical protein
MKPALPDAEARMEVQDGFIVGIFNYCDRWCEICPFTSRCRVFADVARFEAHADATFKALIDAPPHPQDVRERPQWLGDMIDELNAATEDAMKETSTATADDLNSELPAPYAVISTRAKEYAFRVHDWWRATRHEDAIAVTDPRSIILQYSTLIASKTYRALSGLAAFDGDREFPPDHEGSAKVALIAIDRSITAWRDLLATGGANEADVVAFNVDLASLRSELDTAIPRARAFVRPGFDEPDEVRNLGASGA